MIRNLFPGVLVFVLVLASCAGPARRVDRAMPYEDRMRLASIYVQSERLDKAVPVLEDAADQEPGRSEAHAMLGEVLFLGGDLEGSARSLTRALEVGGDDPVVLNNLAWVELKRGNLKEAFAMIERALGTNPVPMYLYLDTRARILQALERYEEALRDARAALRIAPDHDAEAVSKLENLIRELEKMAPGEGYY